MNKIKQNKITFSLILFAIFVTFTSLTILSLPVLFNYKSKVAQIEEKFYQSFKIYLKSSGNISYKPFPKPHLLVENASLNLSKFEEQNNFIKTSNLKIFISLRDIYLRSFDNFISTEILNTNLEIKISSLNKIRKHLYEKVNKPIIFVNCMLFLRNKDNEVILIAPLKKINYEINNKSKIKSFLIDGEVFGFTFKSDWKRNYETPKISFHKIELFNPSIQINNKYEFENSKEFNGQTFIDTGQDKVEFNLYFNNNKIKINSPIKKSTNFNINSNIQLKPFFFEGELSIKNKKVEKIIDNILLKLFVYDEYYLGNINGNLKIKFDELDNKLIKSGEINLSINEREIYLKKATFIIDKIGKINSEISFFENNGDIIFSSKNHLKIKNHIEFAKVFQIGSNKIKKIKDIYFNLEKNIGDTDFSISNVRIDNSTKNISKEIFLVRNIQNLRTYIRNIID